MKQMNIMIQILSPHVLGGSHEEEKSEEDEKDDEKKEKYEKMDKKKTFVLKDSYFESYVATNTIQTSATVTTQSWLVACLTEDSLTPAEVSGGRDAAGNWIRHAHTWLHTSFTALIHR